MLYPFTCRLIFFASFNRCSTCSRTAMNPDEERLMFNVSYATDSRFKLNVLKTPSGASCDICLLSEWNPLRYGEFIEKEFNKGNTLRCHYFCLLSGGRIPQRGKGYSGIAGFLIRDIRDSIKETRDKICAYCGQHSAPVQCNQDGCDRWYHYVCGYKNYCVTQFSGQFKSYCHVHLPAEQRKVHDTAGVGCEICYDRLPAPGDPECNGVAIIRASCDSDCPAGMYHRECLQRYAYTSGYTFQCPNCYNKEFKHFAALSGIFVPQREAAWEREAGAFKDLQKRRCTAIGCDRAKPGLAGHGLVGCRVCGGAIRHASCTQLADPESYVCTTCQDEQFEKFL
ncbi:PHD finger protein 7-like isoform X1 [Anopheles darlingi]|uniref:PHD finger protein 7-like isoform X1 n=2 Tax=Anopheles darlingi TaxID=43151 RepID=UPI0020FFFD67|nr:PHD finger protein 7-like isoform X1 [Anopheles darlingi]